MRMVRWTICAVLLLAACSGAGNGADPGTVAARDAARHVGEKVTVCGDVASSHYAENVRRKPTFVNLDKAYPDPLFTIVVWGDYRDRFAPPPETWSGRVCVSGVVRMYHGHAEMKVISPSQVSH